MKSHNIYILVSLIAPLILLNGCGGGKYSDAKKVTNEYADAMDDFSTAINKSNSAGDVAKAMDSFTDKMAKIAPELKKIQEKYPELQGMTTPPKELEESKKRIEEVTQKYTSSMMKLAQYVNDPQVQKAQERMSQVMQKLQ